VLFAVRDVGGECHSIRVKWQRRGGVEADVSRWIERDLASAAKRNPPGFRNSLNRRRYPGRVAGNRIFAKQTKHYGAIRSVASSGFRERSIKVHVNADNLAEQTEVSTFDNACLGRAPRTHKVGAGWPYAYLEDVEYADCGHVSGKWGNREMNGNGEMGEVQSVVNGMAAVHYRVARLIHPQQTKVALRRRARAVWFRRSPFGATGGPDGRTSVSSGCSRTTFAHSS